MPAGWQGAALRTSVSAAEGSNTASSDFMISICTCTYSARATSACSFTAKFCQQGGPGV